MSSRIAQRRAAKASRRKKLLAERRKLTNMAGRSPLAEQTLRLASAPLYACLLQDGLFERGNGTMILARGAGAGPFAMAVFLLDVYCLGVKDVIFHQGDEAEIEAAVAALGYEAPFTAVDPSYARKLLHDAVAYARSLGFEPHADYGAAERLFGDSPAEACDVSFRFGHDGKPLYIPGPTETPAQVRQRLAVLKRHGAGGLEDLSAADDDDEYGDDDLGDRGSSAYDPSEAPAPAEWLALDEDERLSAVLDHHHQAGISLPNDTVHATFHVVVENQIAEGELPVRQAVERLMAEGLDRHDALHAVASVLARHLHDMAAAGTASSVSNEDYFAAVERLTAESWHRDFGPDDESNER